MPPPKLDAVLTAVASKVDSFIKNNPSFRNACEQAFFRADTEGRGTVTIDAAASAGRAFFSALSGRALDEYGIRLVEPSRAELRRLLEEAGYGRAGSAHERLDRAQFEEFFAACVKWSALRYAGGFTRKYGAGIAAATVGLVILKRVLCTVPVVSAPVRLVPTLLAGPLLGVLGVYAAEQGDLEALQRKLFRAAESAKDAVASKLPGGGGNKGGGFKVG
jgi:hypothetical protein